MSFVYMDKEALKFLILNKRRTHTGYHESFSFADNLDQATIFYPYQRFKIENAEDYLQNKCVQIPAYEERKVYLK